MVCVPAPAAVGLNSPVEALTIPLPLHDPPGVTAARNAFALFTQKGPAGVIVALDVVLTVIVVVCESPHAPPMV